MPGILAPRCVPEGPPGTPHAPTESVDRRTGLSRGEVRHGKSGVGRPVAAFRSTSKKSTRKCTQINTHEGLDCPLSVIHETKHTALHRPFPSLPPGSPIGQCL